MGFLELLAKAAHAWRLVGLGAAQQDNLQSKPGKSAQGKHDKDYDAHRQILVNHVRVWRELPLPVVKHRTSSLGTAARGWAVRCGQDAAVHHQREDDAAKRDIERGLRSEVGAEEAKENADTDGEQYRKGACTNS